MCACFASTSPARQPAKTARGGGAHCCISGKVNPSYLRCVLKNNIRHTSSILHMINLVAKFRYEVPSLQGGAFETLCTHKHCHLSCINIDPTCGPFCSQAVGELSRHQFSGHRVRHGAAGGAGNGRYCRVCAGDVRCKAPAPA